MKIILIAVLAAVAMAAGWMMTKTHAQVVASVTPPPAGLTTTVKFYNDTSEPWEGILSDDASGQRFIFPAHQLTVITVPFFEGQYFLFGPLDGGVPFQINDALIDNNHVHFCFGTQTPDTGYVGRAFSYENTGPKGD
jgi:hypothetical protein